MNIKHRRKVTVKMKRKKLSTMLMGLVFSFSLTGCGTSLYEMTADEQDVVVHYAAYAVSKYNIYQKDGMTSAQPGDEDEKQTKEQETEQPDNSGTTDEQTDKTEKVSLADALGQSSLSVVYNGLDTADNFQEGRVYSLEAGAGNQYAILKFTISNPTDSAVSVDAFNNGHTYKAVFGGSESYEAENTFLTYSLSTYQGTIEAGASVDVVLLFKVPQSLQPQSDSVSLMVHMNDKDYSVEL